ncbi:hypothetical protein Psta_3369 [Pirellula staleyi DSM 6068]|uniref:Uncharacterized protein n=1 Tax=Pirellula staleyi (strain ATCC 27377 / DSM 6068 / ICPB 4128) TaxID=530564 RepID=D2QXV6_PIRSD|nr:hypothetical protein Psta_3369 [Pirellula staleyi DSM 6068]
MSRGNFQLIEGSKNGLLRWFCEDLGRPRLPSGQLQLFLVLRKRIPRLESLAKLCSLPRLHDATFGCCHRAAPGELPIPSDMTTSEHHDDESLIDTLSATGEQSLLQQMNEQQDILLMQLDELNERIEKVLREATAGGGDISIAKAA